MIENIELMITLIFLSILYILLFGESGYIISNIESEYKVNENEEEVEYDDNNLDDAEIDSVDICSDIEFSDTNCLE
jgi:hypothetical protein